jgi:hypothetical protein
MQRDQSHRQCADRNQQPRDPIAPRLSVHGAPTTPATARPSSTASTGRWSCRGGVRPRDHHGMTRGAPNASSNPTMETRTGRTNSFTRNGCIPYAYPRRPEEAMNGRSTYSGLAAQEPARLTFASRTASHDAQQQGRSALPNARFAVLARCSMPHPCPGAKSHGWTMKPPCFPCRARGWSHTRSRHCQPDSRSVRAFES